jgi:hypothetical protein
MSTATLNRDEILDLQGQPLRADAVALLTTLDRLLTVGTYYSTDHEQYLRAVEEACAQLVRAIAPRPAMALEIAAKGLLIEGQTVDVHHRAARKVHDLLVPLNLARLEFRRELTPADLRAALATLQEQRLKLGQAEGFRQVVIDDLPATVSVATQRIGAATDQVSLDELLSGWDSDAPTDAALDADGEWRRLAREFMALADKWLSALESASSSAGDRAGEAQGTPATAEQIAALHDGLRRILEVRPEPAELLRLIQHVRTALDLSRDPGTVDLAFRLMCREVGVDPDLPQEPAQPGMREDLSFTSEMLARSCAELGARNVAIAQPYVSARRDVVAITLRLLVDAPDEPLRTHCQTALEAGIAAADFGTEDLAAIAATFAAVVERGVDLVDRVLPPVLGAVRHRHPEQLADLWERLWHVDATARPALWPHLVNDLLLGLDPAPQSAVLQLWMEANAIDLEATPDLATRLGRLEALAGEGTAARLGDLMLVPASRTGAVLSVLMGSRLAGRVGPLLHQALQRGQGSDLARVLAEALSEYEPAHRRFYADLARELGSETPSPRLARQAAEVLTETLAELTPAERREPWTATAIAWLPTLAGAGARPTLTRILKQRRLLVLPAWPAACREAAGEALERLRAAAPGAD